MSKLLRNVLKISGGQMPQIPPTWLRACVAFIFRCYVNLQVTVTCKNRQHLIYVLAQEAKKSLV